MADYEAIGGGTAVKRVVERFYQLVLADGELAPYFGGVDMRRLKRHQAQLVTTVLGGPGGYEGRDLGAAHAALGITDAHFDRVVGHLGDALGEAGVAGDLVARLAQAVGEARDQVVTVRDGAAGAADPAVGARETR